MSIDGIEVIPLEQMFKEFCQLDDISKRMQVDLLPLSQCLIWFQLANIIDNNHATQTDTGLCFFKFNKRAISYEEFLEYIKDLADVKELDINEVKYKLQTCRRPGYEEKSENEK